MAAISLSQAPGDRRRAKADDIAVVDAGDNLTEFARPDGAFDLPTKDPAVEARSPSGIEASNEGRLIVFAGGIPIEDGDEIVGAVGVNGGTVDQDQEIAEEGVKADG